VRAQPLRHAQGMSRCFTAEDLSFGLQAPAVPLGPSPNGSVPGPVSVPQFGNFVSGFVSRHVFGALAAPLAPRPFVVGLAMGGRSCRARVASCQSPGEQACLSRRRAANPGGSAWRHSLSRYVTLTRAEPRKPSVRSASGAPDPQLDPVAGAAAAPEELGHVAEPAGGFVAHLFAAAGETRAAAGRGVAVPPGD
jgi:hypothetical protein